MRYEGRPFCSADGVANKISRTWPHPEGKLRNTNTSEHRQQQTKPVRLSTKTHRQRSRAGWTSLSQLQYHMAASSRAKPHKAVPNRSRRDAWRRTKSRVATETRRSLPVRTSGSQFCYIWYTGDCKRDAGMSEVRMGYGIIVHDISYTMPSPSLIARFMGPTWGPSGADRTQVDPMLAPWI